MSGKFVAPFTVRCLPVVGCLTPDGPPLAAFACQHRSPDPLATDPCRACKGQPLHLPLAGRRCDAGYVECVRQVAGRPPAQYVEHQSKLSGTPVWMRCPRPLAWNGLAGRRGACRPARELRCPPAMYG